MTAEGSAPCFADRAWFGDVEAIENERIAKDTYRLRLECPAIARRITPGQFVMVRLPGDDPLLGRPFALYDTVLDGAGRPSAIDVVYLVVGKMTRKLAQLRPGDRATVWGPLGNGFASAAGRRLIAVAGGIGQTPFLAVAQEALGLRAYGEPERPAGRAASFVLCYGARSRDYLAGLADFERVGAQVCVSTDDGTAGHRGFVTDLLKKQLDEQDSQTLVYCCGPERMMEAVARLCGERAAPCQASLETPMACGLGICFSCVAKVKDDSGAWDYRRTCVEGPVFDAARIEFA